MLSADGLIPGSGPPKEFEISVAPSAAAVASAASRSVKEVLFASTRRILQVWQVA